MRILIWCGAFIILGLFVMALLNGEKPAAFLFFCVGIAYSPLCYAAIVLRDPL